MSETVGLDPKNEFGDEGEKRLSEIVGSRLQEDYDESDDAVFMSSYIPRTLGEVYDPERDVELVNAGRGDELIYSKLTGVEQIAHSKDESLASAADERARQEAGSADGDDKDSDERSDGPNQEEGEDIDVVQRPRGFRNEDKEVKKVSGWDCISRTA